MLPEGGGPSVSADRTGVARAFLTDTPAEVMQLPVQDVADSKEQMILRAVCDERISVPVESPGGGTGAATRSSGGSAQSLTQWPPRLHQRHDQADGP